MTIEGIVPVMLTPFDDAGAIDTPAERLIEWYLAHGADALFAVAQSSEMQFLSLERAELARLVVERVAGRVPVVASGHISDDLDAQAESARGGRIGRAGRRARDQSTRSAAQGSARCSTICSARALAVGSAARAVRVPGALPSAAVG